MSVKDVIKNSVLESISTGAELTFGKMVFMLVIAFLVGVYIYYAYKNFSRLEFYSRDLNITIAGMTVAVASIVIAMQANLIVSLGMVGALSIVRFRTAIKNPLDLLYLFWAICVGIICGVGLYGLVIIMCGIMTVLIIVLGLVPNKKTPQLLILHMTKDAVVETVQRVVNENSTYYRQKSIITRNDDKEVIFEIKTTMAEKIVDDLGKIEGVKSVNCLEHDGDLRI